MCGLRFKFGAIKHVIVPGGSEDLEQDLYGTASRSTPVDVAFQ